MSAETSAGVPPRSVLDAFGLAGEPTLLSGGEGSSVRVDGAVLKPADDPEEAAWRARVLDGLVGRGIRVPRALRTGTGHDVVEGWTAAEFLPGAAGPAGRWGELLRAGRAFHEALSDVPRPGFLDRRTHPWAVADRVAWGEQTVDALAPLDGLLRRLYALREPVNAPLQVIHGDLTGNVLFAEGLEPAVIDFSPYWRPAAYADAIVAVDGLLYYGAGRRLIGLGGSAGSAGSAADFPQLLVRALIFRLATLNGLTAHADAVPADEVRRFTAVTALIAELAGPGGRVSR